MDILVFGFCTRTDEGQAFEVLQIGLILQWNVMNYVPQNKGKGLEKKYGEDFLRGLGERI